MAMPENTKNNTSGKADAKAEIPKRFTFSKPSWSKTDAPVTEERDLFSRSKDSYAGILKEQEERRKRKEARRDRERQREKYGVEEGGGKRRRVSTEEEDAESPLVRPHGPSHSPPSVSSTVKPQAENEGRKQAVAARPRNEHRSQANAVLLSDDDDETIKVVEPTKPVVQNEDEELESDEEMAALARKARERARSQGRSEGTEGKKDPRSSDHNRPVSGSGSLSKDRHTNSSQTPEADQAKVEILITSQLPSTNPLIVHRRLHQRLKDVRLTWCSKQGFSDEVTKTVFLTWRGKRLFDVTTCKGLGIGVDAEGNVLMKGEKDMIGEEDRQIHMEAMDEAIFQERRKKREKRTEAREDMESEPPPPESATENRDDTKGGRPIRLVLRSREYDDFKLIVKQSTKISRVIGAFVRANKIASEKIVSLIFDGDKLEPDLEIAEAELGDMDFIDISIK